MRTSVSLLLCAVFTLVSRSQGAPPTPPAPLVGENVVFEESDGMVAVEAEHFFRQTGTEHRAWYITSATAAVNVPPDPDPAHVVGASGGAYVEALPDTRVTGNDAMVTGENFTDRPPRLATLHYRVRFTKPGRYYVWCRVFSTGTEDNGVHVGLDGTWPESGKRWQTTEKRRWVWDSRQRTPQNHLGEPGLLYLDVATAGVHEVQFSMREDGFEMDKFVLTIDPQFRPDGTGPEPRKAKRD